MKTSFSVFLKRNWAAARLSVLSQLEYRLNFLLDCVFQPIVTTAIEVTIWMSIFKGIGASELGGFSREMYLSYSLWATFVGRITINWLYEYTMMEEIDTGRVNALLVRPISFYEYFLSQFLAYKLLCAVVSFAIPVVVCLFFDAPMIWERLPGMFLLVTFYLIFVHTLSFTVACFAFFFNRVYGFSGMKNLALWVLSGELIPLDLYPEPLRTWILRLPFSAGVYIPVSYVTGRIGPDQFYASFVNVGLGLIVVGCLAMMLWKSGVRSYTGTGA